MKQVFTLPQTAELELLKNMLEEAGIPCALRNEQLSQAFPATPFNVELWVANDDDFPRAQELCQGLAPSPARCNRRLGLRQVRAAAEEPVRFVLEVWSETWGNGQT